MRVFRIKARNKNGRIVNMREYASLAKLRSYGHDLFRRYNRYAIAELYEINSNGKWILVDDALEVRKLLNPYSSDEK